MILLLTGKKITGLSDVGTYPGSVTVSDDALPEDFGVDFAPGKWLYMNGEIVKNPGYVPVPEPPAPGESLEDIIQKIQADMAYIAMMSDVELE